jgi:predicted kinase
LIVPESSLVLLVGPPASGKSTLAAGLVRAGEVAADDVLSTDDYRRAVTGDAGDTSRDRKVWARLRRDLTERMAAGRTTVVDATNLFPRRRARHIAVAREHARPVVAIRFDVAIPHLLERNERRARVVKPGAVVGMAVHMRREVGTDTLLGEGVDTVLEATAVRRLLG